MVSSVHEDKVSELESNSPVQSTTSTPGRLGKRKRGKEDGNGSSRTPKLLPRVERTNTLPIADFIEAYVPRPSLKFTITDHSSSADNSTATTTTKKGSTTLSETYTLEIHSAASIPSADFQACFNLIELTSSNDYGNSSIGWSPSKKRKEMKLPDMRYMVLKKQEESKSERTSNAESTKGNGTSQEAKDIALGFLSFMVTYEDGKEVIYCYEIHLAPAMQGKGVGKRMMDLYEEIGRRVGLEKAMLTVFKANAVASRFYERLGYEVDEYSPQPRKLRNGTIKEPDYVILSKPLNNVVEPQKKSDAE
ncbi:GNAT family acetyltransferase Nat4, putative [Paecilomyces variotii No. 5]|uniref:N-alpha-acetyltransferase 40 n=1 Tax=Byssochlamys spectabilis (strain No. 5 / NBRC 109023) TaxID=1356009 RepID=V5FZI7_BYSSN|nr:GNAT family acetyltransferase Nat4, putative [Paecilomyces variotii No. 5]